MKKIMFNDRFGLTDAVLSRQKTMTRRLVNLPSGTEHSHVFSPKKKIDNKGKVYFTFNCIDAKERDVYPYYQIGEEVAIAQRYSEIPMKVFMEGLEEKQKFWQESLVKGSFGWRNKMGAQARFMPHRIRITDIKVERLADISDKDCEREGVIPITWRQWLPQDWDDLSPQRYRDHYVWSLPKFEEGITDSWAENEPDEYMAESAQVAFAVLIFKLMGKKTWYDNPWVFAYKFELIK